MKKQFQVIYKLEDTKNINFTSLNTKNSSETVFFGSYMICERLIFLAHLYIGEV